MLVFSMALILPAPAMATSTRTLKRQIAALKKEVKYYKAANARNHVVMAEQESVINVFVPETLMLERVVEISGYSLDDGTFHDYLYNNFTDISDNYESADEYVDLAVGTLPFTSAGVHPTSATASGQRSLSMRSALAGIKFDFVGATKE